MVSATAKCVLDLLLRQLLLQAFEVQKRPAVSDDFVLVLGFDRLLNARCQKMSSTKQ